MKHLIFSIFSILYFCLAEQVYGQVLNNSFENWITKTNQISVSGTATIQGITGTYSIMDPPFSYNEIEDWSSLNQLTGTESITNPTTGSTMVELVNQSSDFVDGVTSVQIRSERIKISASFTVFGFTIDTSVTNVAPGLLISGVFDLDENLFASQLINQNNLSSLNPFEYEGTGQAIDFQPKHLRGQYKYTGVNGDSALIVSGLIKNREIVAYTIKRLPNAATWTPFSLEYTYNSCEQPDTIVSVFCSSNLYASFEQGQFIIDSSYTGEDGSFFLVDDLSLDTIDLASFPPIAVNDTSNVFIGDSIYNLVINNDIICSNDTLMPQVIQSTVSNGIVFVDTSGVLTFQADANFTGTLAIDYYICTSLNFCDTATWYISIQTVPSCIANDDYRSLNMNESSSFNPLANDIDCSGTFDIYRLPMNGVANISNNTLNYSSSNYVGLDSLTYYTCSSLNNNQCDTAVVFYEILDPSTNVKDAFYKNVSIWPNPAYKEINVKLPLNIKDQVDVSLFDLLGNRINSKDFKESTTINIQGLSQGIYFLEIKHIGKRYRYKVQVN